MAFGDPRDALEPNFHNGFMHSLDIILLVNLHKLLELAGFIEIDAFVVGALAKK